MDLPKTDYLTLISERLNLTLPTLRRGADLASRLLCLAFLDRDLSLRMTV